MTDPGGTDGLDHPSLSADPASLAWCSGRETEIEEGPRLASDEAPTSHSNSASETDQAPLEVRGMSCGFEYVCFVQTHAGLVLSLWAGGEPRS